MLFWSHLVEHLGFGSGVVLIQQPIGGSGCLRGMLLVLAQIHFSVFTPLVEIVILCH
jgi:hypothetical protein